MRPRRARDPDCSEGLARLKAGIGVEKQQAEGEVADGRHQETRQKPSRLGIIGFRPEQRDRQNADDKQEGHDLAGEEKRKCQSDEEAIVQNCPCLRNHYHLMRRNAGN